MEQQSHFEWSADAQLRLFDQKLTLIGSRRVAAEDGDGVSFRKEWYISADYEFYKWGPFHFAGLMGFISQHYNDGFYNEVLTGGLMIRIH